MKLVTDPAIALKISRMKERVRWRHPFILKREIDQTQLVIDGAELDNPDFSFLVIGDSGSGYHRGDNPQRRVAKSLLSQQQACRFILHTGDVIYLVGSSEQYPQNFIRPYREFLVGGENPQQIAYDRMVFNYPFLPVPGNHDYYDLPFVFGAIAQTFLPVRRLLRYQLDLDVGWHGSRKGDAYAKAFLDYLLNKDGEPLARHLDRHYTAKTSTQRCLRYQPGHFTRLPNRYYSFRVGGIDFFALDSNTFNAPLPLEDLEVWQITHQQLIARRQKLLATQQSLLNQATDLESQPDAADSDEANDLYSKVEQIEEQIRDIEKQLNADQNSSDVDTEQLHWLQTRLIESWQDPAVRGRVLYFHHPPYVTEATKWYQGQTLAIRYRLRQVLDQVQQALGDRPPDQPLVDLVISGHAHCFEYLRTEATGHADANLNWVVCGGSGYSLRRQRPEGAVLTEILADDQPQIVAKSHCFAGRNGHGSQKRHPFSFLRVDVQAGQPVKIILRPFIVERHHRQWKEYALPPINL
ncbi:metallophosphoesterase family protein [Almyronema epifaneia]|uniref:Metallophosphoesterase family protein n=1 Tax=Almyronema epifaneia S1 TaxID=2991925 RepID=A0ABW6IBN7_9CYAN